MGRYDEETQGNQLLSVILQERLASSDREGLPMSGYVFGHGCLTPFDSHLRQFPRKERPTRVSEAH